MLASFYYSPIQIIKYYWDKIPFFHKKKLITNPNQDYYQKNRRVFMDSLCKDSSQNMNQNIQSEFYDKTLFQEIMKEENNKIESIWRTRILMQNTPRGNIIMFYDAYSQGFSYYSDNTGIPYFILNAMAMQYVVKFYCRDFFIDNLVTQDITREHLKENLTLENLVSMDSPLIAIYYTEDKKNENKKSQVLNNTSNLPFVKFKNYTVTNNKHGLTTVQSRTFKDAFLLRFKYFINTKINVFWRWFWDLFKFSNKKKMKDMSHIKYDKEHTFNKFIRLGKLSNFNILQKQPEKNPLNGFHSKLLDGVQSDSKVQKQVMNYSEYKKILQDCSNKIKEEENESYCSTLSKESDMQITDWSKNIDEDEIEIIL